MAGYRPILNHPERNRGVRREPERLYRLLEGGVQAMVTAGSLLGRFGPAVAELGKMGPGGRPSYWGGELPPSTVSAICTQPARSAIWGWAGIFDVWLEAHIQSTGVPGLTRFTSGAILPNPAELLGSGRMENMLRELEERFDMVVIDSPGQEALVAVKANLLGVVLDWVKNDDREGGYLLLRLLWTVR